MGPKYSDRYRGLVDLWRWSDREVLLYALVKQFSHHKILLLVPRHWCFSHLLYIIERQLSRCLDRGCYCRLSGLACESTSYSKFSIMGEGGGLQYKLCHYYCCVAWKEGRSNGSISHKSPHSILAPDVQRIPSCLCNIG